MINIFKSKLFLFLLFTITFVNLIDIYGQNNSFFLYGYAQLDYQASTKNNTYSGFNQRRLNIIGEFNYYNRLRVIGDVEYEGGVDIAVGDSSSFGNVKVSRAIIEYSFSPEFKFNVGKMITHFGLYNLVHDASASYYSVDPPIMYSKLKVFDNQTPQRLFGKYLIGISLLGTFDLNKNGSQLDYFIGIGNGRGLDNEGNDLNNNRAVNARIIFRPSFLYGLGVGASFYTDRNYNGISGMQNSRETSYALDLQFENNFLQIQSETMYSKFEVTNGNFQNSVISSIQVAYTLWDVFTPFFNYTMANLNLEAEDNSFTRFNFGLNYSLLPNLFIKSEIQFHSSEEDHQAQESYTLFKATIAVAF